MLRCRSTAVPLLLLLRRSRVPPASFHPEAFVRALSSSSTPIKRCPTAPCRSDPVVVIPKRYLSSSSNSTDDDAVKQVVEPNIASTATLPEENETSEALASAIQEASDADIPDIPKFRMFPVYTRYDIEDLLQNEDPVAGNPQTYADDAAVAMSAPFDLSEIHRLTKEAFGTVKDMQYHNGTTWAPLLSHEDVDELRASLERHPLHYQRIVPIKIPQYYDEFGQAPVEGEAPRDEDDEDEAPPGPIEPPPDLQDPVPVDPGLVQLSQTIEQLMQRLQQEDMPWQVSHSYMPEQLVLKEDTAVLLPTREWIVAQAEPARTDQVAVALRKLLYQYPHAVDHIASCLHLFGRNNLLPFPSAAEEEEEDSLLDREDALPHMTSESLRQ